MRILKRLALFLACAALLCLALGAAAEFGPVATPTYPGVDVSQWQGDIDFEQVRDAGVWGVYIRSSLGADYKDPYFVRNAEGARAAGLQYGFYHFLTATSTEEADAQAAFFARLIGAYDATLRPVMDFGVSETVLDDDDFNRVAAAFLSRVEQLTGVTPAIYSDAYGAKTRYYASLAVYPLWVADYGATSPEANDKWSGWAGWQYSDEGRVSGIDARVDLDYFTPALLLAVPTPTVSPTATPTVAPTPPCPPTVAPTATCPAGV